MAKERRTAGAPDAEQLEEDLSRRKALAGEAKLFTNGEGRGWITEAEISAANVSLSPEQMGS